MRKKILMLFVFVLFVTFSIPVNYTAAEISGLSIIDSGSGSPNATVLPFTSSKLFSRPNTRATVITGIMLDMSNEFNSKAPFPAEKVFSAAMKGCWLGITSDEKDLVYIGVYDNGNALLVIKYNPRGRLDYTLYSIPEGISEEKYPGIVSSLFEQESVTDYYLAETEDIFSAFEGVGLHVTRN